MNIVNEELVRERLKDVMDPELQMSIMELGLVYGVEIEDAKVKVIYTLTSPACPLGTVIEGQIQSAVMGMPGV